jgi:hypothetical protein
VDSCLTWQFSPPKNATRADSAVGDATAVAVAVGPPPAALSAGVIGVSFPMVIGDFAPGIYCYVM